MKRIINLIFLISFVFCSELEKGIVAYENRASGAIGTKAEPSNINQAITYFERAVKITANEEEATVYLLKSYYYKGTFVVTDHDERKAIYNQGKDLAEKMIVKYPNSVPLRYWYLTCLGKWSEMYGIFTAAKEGVAGVMKAHSETIIDLDPEYNHGGGYFMLGAVHYKSPYIPFILSWPTNDDAIFWLKKAVNTGEATPVQKNYLSKALYKDKQENAAIRLVKEVISTSPDTDFLVEDRYEIEEAKKLLTDYE